jgi:hypothetical protein
MKKLFALLFCVALFSAACAQKTINDPNAEKRTVNTFHGISVGGGIDLFLTQGDESVAVSASETKFRDRIKTEVKDGILKIWYDHNGFNVDWNGNRKMKAYVSYRTLDMLHGGGGSDITVDGILKAAKFSLNVSGGSDFSGKVQMGDLQLEASGGSDVEISGTAATLEINASGGSDVNGYELIADRCNIDVSGGSDVDITVNQELTAEASGGSDISYKGTGVVKEMKSSGSSSIKKAGK